MKAVQFGAGNIGRGFLGQLYFESGYTTTFVDIVPEVVDGLRTRGEYPLRIVGEVSETLRIADVTAIYSTDVEAVARALAETDIAATAVGVNVLPRVAPAIARGIETRFARADAAPLDIIVCENLIDAGSFLREKVREHLDSRLHETLENKVGFVEASIGRMVPVITPAMKAKDALLVCVEPYCELPVDANGFKGSVPPLRHLLPKPNFKAYVERKLFVHNAGHATVAYLGYLAKYDLIWIAMDDSDIREAADAAMAETCAGLCAKFGLDSQDLREHWRDLKRRFANHALRDQITRVAADPIRKLGPNDRLIGAARMCLEQGIAPEYVAFAAAAAIRYDHPSDPAARKLQEIRQADGLDGVLTQICRLGLDSPLADLIRRGDDRLRAQEWV